MRNGCKFREEWGMGRGKRFQGPHGVKKRSRYHPSLFIPVSCLLKLLLSISLLLFVFACTSSGPGSSVDPEKNISFDADSEDLLRIKIAQMLLIGFRGTELSADSRIYRDIKELGIGGVLLFDYDMPSRSRPRNILSKDQLTHLTRDLQNSAAIKLFIAIDQEGGRVNRLPSEYGFPPALSAKEMGAEIKGELTKTQAEETARLLSEMGINLNFAPCVDLDINPSNPIIGIYGRSFSADSEVVANHAAIWINAHSRYGVLSCIKHFPGHGSSTGDTHQGTVDVTATWQEAELTPYRILLRSRQGRELMVMTSHVFNTNLDPQNPATLSGPVITGILRNQLGFKGIVVSDDLDMAAIKANYTFEETLEKAINAGVDLLCLSNNGSHYNPLLAQKAVDTIAKLAAEGKISAARIDESYRRIIAAKTGITIDRTAP
jgi:beta-N-acetylhexosaminidase